MDVDDKTARLLDANLDRAREGLRVIEDTARFLWNDRAQYERLRRLRHRLHELTKNSYRAFLEARETRNDVGRRLKEPKRSSIAAVIGANFRRAEEAVRVLEEYSKVFAPTAASGFKSVRYALYQEEKKILKRL